MTNSSALPARRPRTVAALGLGLALALSACGGDADDVARPAAQVTYTAADVPVLVPGGPGEPAKVVAPGEQGTLPNSLAYGDADVAFISDMVPHHLQALEMARLAPDRAADERVRRLAERIGAVQQPEVDVMQAWLGRQGLPEADTDHGAHADMPGMASPEDLFSLGQLTGAAFDRRFLELMTAHHAGAVAMAGTADLEAQSVFVQDLAKDVSAEQSVEIGRMQAVLAEL